MTNWTLRQAAPADATGLTDCFRAAYAVYTGRVDDLPDVAGSIAEEVARHPVWVAVSGNRVLGGVVVVLGKTAHLANVAVHPDASGQGIGRALIAQAERAAADAGYSALHLATHVKLTENIAFYTHLGWVETRREGNKVLMSRPL